MVRCVTDSVSRGLFVNHGHMPHLNPNGATHWQERSCGPRELWLITGSSSQVASLGQIGRLKTFAVVWHNGLGAEFS